MLECKDVTNLDTCKILGAWLKYAFRFHRLRGTMILITSPAMFCLICRKSCSPRKRKKCPGVKEIIDERRLWMLQLKKQSDNDRPLLLMTRPNFAKHMYRLVLFDLAKKNSFIWSRKKNSFIWSRKKISFIWSRKKNSFIWSRKKISFLWSRKKIVLFDRAKK